MRILKKIKSLLQKKHLVAYLTSKPIKKITWYKDSHGDMVKFKRQKFNTRIAVLGSSPAKWAFDDSVADACANWATSPQSIFDDFRVLKNYHSYLSPNGLVLISLFHCRALMQDYNDAHHFKKFHYFLHPILNPFYDEKVFLPLKKEIDFPIYYVIKHPIRILKSVIKCDVLKKISCNSVTNSMNEVQIEQDAEKWMSIWKKEFSEDAFNTPLKASVRESLEFNKKLILEMAEFCKERDLKLAFVIPPITNALKSKFSKEFSKEALYDLIAPAQEKYNISLFDYLEDKEFQNDDLYFNSFFLNKRGRRLFTEKLINDVKNLKI
jgi:hypothetical protein